MKTEFNDSGMAEGFEQNRGQHSNSNEQADTQGNGQFILRHKYTGGPRFEAF